jgi:hypothetical protein
LYYKHKYFSTSTLLQRGVKDRKLCPSGVCQYLYFCTSAHLPLASRQRLSGSAAYVRIRQHTSAYVSGRYFCASAHLPIASPLRLSGSKALVLVSVIVLLN